MIGLIELTIARIYSLKRMRVKRPVHLISFVRRVNRRSMKIHRRLASIWLKYLRAREGQWVNDSISTMLKLARKFDAAPIVIEDLDAQGLKQKLKSKDPDLAQRCSTWPLIKLMRGWRTKSSRLENNLSY